MDTGTAAARPSRSTLASAMIQDRHLRTKPLSRSPPSSSSLSSSSSTSTRASLILAFVSCLAWLYVAGRLWQDAQSRILLSALLQRSAIQHPRMLTVEDKLTSLGCKKVGKKMVDVEMDLTLAKSRGYLRQGNSSSTAGQKLLAVVGVYTGFGSRLKRNVFRGSWMPTGDALRRLEEKGVVLRFIIGRSANRGDSLDKNIDKENRRTNDFFILENHEEASEESPKKVKFFFSAAVEMWDAEFYVKVDDNINLDLDGLTEILEKHRGQLGTYMGCMKSGEVIGEIGKQWYEPDWWKFGDGKSYFRHAGGSLLILSKNLARFININSASLQTYAHDDTSVGSWIMGLQAKYVDDNRLCCSSSRQDKVCSLA